MAVNELPPLPFRKTHPIFAPFFGRDMTANRLSDIDAKKVIDAQAAFDKRFDEQTPAPGSEAAVRRMIEELRIGKPDYDQMSSGVAAATQQQLSQLQPMISGLGITVNKLQGVGPGGADIHQVKFDKGFPDYRVRLAPDGKIGSANLRPSE